MIGYLACSCHGRSAVCKCWCCACRLIASSRFLYYLASPLLISPPGHPSLLLHHKYYTFAAGTHQALSFAAARFIDRTLVGADARANIISSFLALFSSPAVTLLTSIPPKGSIAGSVRVWLARCIGRTTPISAISETLLSGTTSRECLSTRRHLPLGWRRGLPRSAERSGSGTTPVPTLVLSTGLAQKRGYFRAASTAGLGLASRLLSPAMTLRISPIPVFSTRAAASMPCASLVSVFTRRG